MAKLTIELTEEHIKLIKNLYYKKLAENIYGIDVYDLYGGSYKFEQMALILGYGDKVIPETVEDIFGPRYEADVQKHLEELDEFIISNLSNIEEILHQFCNVGITCGKYTCKDNVHLWSKIE